MIALLFVTLFLTTQVLSSLQPDNPSHRSFSNKMDEICGDSPAYDKYVRPVVHGAYHAARYVDSIDVDFQLKPLSVDINVNSEEWARSKDQLSKFGTGQAKTDYLKEVRDQQN